MALSLRKQLEDLRLDELRHIHIPIAPPINDTSSTNKFPGLATGLGGQLIDDSVFCRSLPSDPAAIDVFPPVSCLREQLTAPQSTTLSARITEGRAISPARRSEADRSDEEYKIPVKALEFISSINPRQSSPTRDRKTHETLREFLTGVSPSKRVQPPPFNESRAVSPRPKSAIAEETARVLNRSSPVRARDVSPPVRHASPYKKPASIPVLTQGQGYDQLRYESYAVPTIANESSGSSSTLHERVKGQGYGVND